MVRYCLTGWYTLKVFYIHTSIKTNSKIFSNNLFKLERNASFSVHSLPVKNGVKRVIRMVSFWCEVYFFVNIKTTGFPALVVGRCIWKLALPNKFEIKNPVDKNVYIFLLNALLLSMLKCELLLGKQHTCSQALLKTVIS